MSDWADDEAAQIMEHLSVFVPLCISVALKPGDNEIVAAFVERDKTLRAVLAAALRARPTDAALPPPK